MQYPSNLKRTIVPISMVGIVLFSQLGFAAELDQLPTEPLTDSQTEQSTQQTQTTLLKTQETQLSTQQNTQTQAITQTQETDDSPAFKDVQNGDSHFVAIKYLKALKLIDGYEDGTFKPDQEINRAEALKILFKAIKGVETKNHAEFTFKDVKNSDWFYEYIKKGWDSYLVKGYDDKLFHPEKNINLAEALKIIILQEGSTVPVEVGNKPYSDVETTAWYAPYAQVAKEKGLYLESRDGGKLNADTVLTRGSFAELIYRILKSESGSNFTRASWYDGRSSSTITASGEILEPDGFTAAHKTLPFGTKLLVTDLRNGKSVTVKVNDRGPYATGIGLDLSKSAFQALAPVGTGIITVEFHEIK